MSVKASSPGNDSSHGWLLESLYRVAHWAIRARHTQHRHPWLWSLRILQRVADRGHLPAITEFGAILFCQGACRTEKSIGLDYLRVAARSGVAEAQYQLGLGYSCGSFWLERDAQQATHWLHLAAENGHAAAQVRLTELLYSDSAQNPTAAQLASADSPQAVEAAGFTGAPDKAEKKAVLSADVT